MKTDFIVKLKYGGFIVSIGKHEIHTSEDVNDAKHFTITELKKDSVLKRLLKKGQANFYGRKDKIQ